MKTFAKATDIFVPMAVGKNSLAKSVLLRLSLVCTYGDGRFVIIKVFVCCAYCIYIFPNPVVYLFIGSLRPLRRGSCFLEVFLLLSKVDQVCCIFKIWLMLLRYWLKDFQGGV